MNIGPLVSQPAIVSFAGAFNAALNQAGVMWGDGLRMPSGITDDAGIAYTSGEMEYLPLVRAFGHEADARSVYEEALSNAGETIAGHFGVRPTSVRGALFLDQARSIDQAMGMGAEDIADVIRDPAFFDECTLAEMNGMLSSLDFLGGRSIRRFTEMRGEEFPGSGHIGTDSGILRNAAETVGFVARKGHESGILDADDAAVFHFISGILYWSMGIHDGSGNAIRFFLASANCFAEARNPVAAAIAAETAAYLHVARGGDDHIVEGNNAFADAAEYWLNAAEGMNAEFVGMLIALWRGITADFMRTDTHVDEMPKRLYTLSAAFNSEFGRYVDAGADYMRLAFIASLKSEGDQSGWEALSYNLQMAIGAYRSAGGHDDLLVQLEGLDALARGEAEALEEELAILNSETEDGVDIVEQTRNVGLVKFRHGNFKGALNDLQQVDGWEPDMPGVLSDIGLVYHHQAGLLSVTGNERGVRGSLENAEYYLDRALEAAELNKMDVPPIFHARLGALHATKGDYGEAVLQLEIAREMAEKKGEISRYLAAVEGARDKPTKSRPTRNGGLTLVHGE